MRFVRVWSIANKISVTMMWSVAILAQAIGLQIFSARAILLKHIASPENQSVLQEELCICWRYLKGAKRG